MVLAQRYEIERHQFALVRFVLLSVFSSSSCLGWAAACDCGILWTFLFLFPVVLLLQFFVCVSVVSYVSFVLSLFVPHLSFFWCLEKAVLPDCGISWISSLIFFIYSFFNMFFATLIQSFK